MVIRLVHTRDGPVTTWEKLVGGKRTNVDRGEISILIGGGTGGTGWTCEARIAGVAGIALVSLRTLQALGTGIALVSLRTRQA